MQKHFLKFGKVFIKFACSPLILISNNSELAAKYLPNDVDQSIKTLEIPNINNRSEEHTSDRRSSVCSSDLLLIIGISKVFID